MIILLSKIPADTQKEDIDAYLRPVVRGPFYFKKGTIKSIKLFILKDKQLNELEHYGLVKIEPDEVAERTIKKLNRKFFKGKRIAVREYACTRIWQNDRRDHCIPCDLNSKDRRLFDRRREHLEMIDCEMEEITQGTRYPRQN
jgi:hypothetical protein